MNNGNLVVGIVVSFIVVLSIAFLIICVALIAWKKGWMRRKSTVISGKNISPKDNKGEITSVEEVGEVISTEEMGDIVSIDGMGKIDVTTCPDDSQISAIGNFIDKICKGSDKRYELIDKNFLSAFGSKDPNATGIEDNGLYGILKGIEGKQGKELESMLGERIYKLPAIQNSVKNIKKMMVFLGWLYPVFAERVMYNAREIKGGGCSNIESPAISDEMKKILPLFNKVVCNLIVEYERLNGYIDHSLECLFPGGRGVGVSCGVEEKIHDEIWKMPCLAKLKDGLNELLKILGKRPMFYASEEANDWPVEVMLLINLKEDGSKGVNNKKKEFSENLKNFRTYRGNLACSTTEKFNSSIKQCYPNNNILDQGILDFFKGVGSAFPQLPQRPSSKLDQSEPMPSFPFDTGPDL